MPPLTLPPGVPLGLWWYALWISVNGLFIFLLRLLRDPDGQLHRDATRDVERHLPGLNEYLWRLVNESPVDPYEGPLNSADDVSKLVRRSHDANKAVSRLNLLRRHTGIGIVAGCSAVISALICGILYLLKYPTVEVISLVGIIGFAIFTLWTLWHIVNSLIRYFLIVRVANEEE